uniref:response regulator transcription factor n=1 Tax=Aliarcobacter sp. TaxID=2321116 RepID=UPI004048139B
MTNNLSLLYVEDDLVIVENLLFFLKRYFTNIYIAEDGERAFELFKTNKPDVIILDISIPKMNGLKLAAKIREEDKETPIIFISAHNEKEKLLEALNLQVFSYIIKPLNVEKLILTIDKCINHLEEIKKVNDEKVTLTDGFFWDSNEKTLFFNDNKIFLSIKESLLIELFVSNNSRIFDINDIIKSLNFENKIKNNSMSQIIYRLRKKIAEVTGQKLFFIEYINKKGYKLKCR